MAVLVVEVVVDVDVEAEMAVVDAVVFVVVLDVDLYSQGATVDLACRVSPASDLSWRREGGEIPGTASQLGNLLRKEDVSVEDSSRYVCTSGGRMQYITLLIESKIIKAVPCQVTRSNFKCNSANSSVYQWSLRLGHVLVTIILTYVPPLNYFANYCEYFCYNCKMQRLSLTNKFI